MSILKKLIRAISGRSISPTPPTAFHFETLEERVLLTATLGATDETAAIFDPTPFAALTGDDKYDENDTFETAKDLKLKANKAFVAADLISADDDWFKFQITGSGNAWNFAQIAFENFQGDIDLQLYNSSNQLLKSSLSTGNFESIDMSGLAAGTYYIRVFCSSGETGQSYDLSINAPSKYNGEHTLYLNFDGAELSRTELETWENGEWLAGMLNYFDSNNNGISIGDFLSSLADREKIIANIIKYVQTDLNKFGIQVVRHFGDAVADVEATTIFLGPSTLSNGYHIANDIDFGNSNMTDIAFVGNEDWGNSKSTAIAMADVTLHEAGHTFGLYHVVSGNDNETMGLRYNQPDQNKWVRNTQFRNEYYDVLPGHGPAMEQNAAAYMKSVFVTNTSNPAGMVFDPNWNGEMEDHMDSLPTIGWTESQVSSFSSAVASDVTESVLSRWALKSQL